MKARPLHNAGFTFIEVLLAIVIFVIAAIVALDLTKGSVRVVEDAKTMTTATLLLKNAMVELETKVETQGFDKGCDKKKTGKFEPPFQNFSWTSYCTEIDYNLSQTAAQLEDQAKEKTEDQDETKDPNQENMLEKMILQTASDYISKSLRELHVEVSWKEGKQTRKVDVTTHVARYDQPLNLPGMTSSGTSPTPTPNPTTGVHP